MKDNNSKPEGNSSHSSEEEIDLGQLFMLIGRGFDKLFNFIKSIFVGAFTVLINIVLFFRRNSIIIFGSAILGAVLGGIHQYGYKTPVYESSMTIKPNYGSTVQLYKNIDFYTSLIKQADYERLASSLNISVDEAKNITSMEVEPYSNQNQSLVAYRDFISDLDTNTVNLIDYKSFAEEQPVETFKYHLVYVRSKDKYIFSKLKDPLINSIIRNKYYDKVKITSFENLLSKKKAIESSMSELDSLRSLYKEVLLSESKNAANGTSIYMGDAATNDKEVVVFDKYMSLNEDLITVNKQLTEENEVINVVSSFNPVGMKVSKWYTNSVVLGFLLFGFITVSIISLIKINKLLTTYEKRVE